MPLASLELLNYRYDHREIPEKCIDFIRIVPLEATVTLILILKVSIRQESKVFEYGKAFGSQRIKDKLSNLNLKILIARKNITTSRQLNLISTF